MFGLIESMTESEATGWVVLPEGESYAYIKLLFNEKEILKFRTTEVISRSGVHGTVACFSLRFKSVWRYMSPQDNLSFEYSGEKLFISGHGYCFSHAYERITNSKVMFRKLNEGYIFNQKGFLRLSKTLDHEWQKNVISLYHNVRDFLKERHDLDVFVMSGTLLGTVRQGEFIGHDHDFDIGLISKKTTGDGAKKESKDFSKDLLDHGYRLQLKPSCTYISHPDFEGAQVDLVRMYFDQSGVLRSAFGFATDKVFFRDNYRGTVKASLSGHEVDVPESPESYLEVIYGEDWKIPNPTFNWSRELKVRDKASRFTQAEIQELYSYSGQ